MLFFKRVIFALISALTLYIGNCDKSVNKERETGTGDEEPERGTRNRNGGRGTGTGDEALERGTRNPTTLSK